MPRGRATNSAMTTTTTANVDGTKVIVAGPKTNTSGAKIAHAEIRLLVPRRQKHAKRRVGIKSGKVTAIATTTTTFVVAPGTVATVVGALLLPRNIATLRKRTNTERSLVACASILNTFPTKAMAVDKLAAKANVARQSTPVMEIVTTTTIIVDAIGTVVTVVV